MNEHQGLSNSAPQQSTTGPSTHNQQLPLETIRVQVLGMCEPCREAVIRLLDDRIKRTLEVARGEHNEDSMMTAHTECFHFMELKRIMQGKSTSGVYDDFGRSNG